MTEPPRVLFYPDSGPGVGGGHVLRCLALAEALAARGARPVFAVAAEGRRLLQRFAGADVEVVDRGPELAEQARALGAAAVVVDDYGLDAAGEAGLDAARLLVAVDDLADRPHRAALLIDPSYGRAPGDYAGLLPTSATVLAGPRYALLRGAFGRAEPITVRPAVRQVFVSFGLADPGGITARAVRLLLPALPGADFDVALGSTAESLDPLRALAAHDPRLRLHVETDRVADLLAQADMAVGAGGSSTWERAAYGVPSLSVVVADNQRALAHIFAAAGAQATLEADDAGFDDALVRAAVAAAEDATLRARLAERSRALCDGRGAERVAEAILEALPAARFRQP